MNKTVHTLFAMLVILIMASSKVQADNQVFLNAIFPSFQSWQDTFPVAYLNPACNGKTVLNFRFLLSAAKRHPHFLNNGSPEKNVREWAAFLANVSQETTGAAEGQYDGGLCFSKEVGGEGLDYCSILNEEWAHKPLCPYGYYGRGALQITNPYNYYEASQEVFGDDRLLDDPDLILEGDLAWEASIIFWMKHKGGLASSGTSIDGYITPHEAIVLHHDFGKTIEVINGNLECQSPGDDFRKRTKGRIEYYKKYIGKFSKQLGVLVPNEEKLDCYYGTVDPSPVESVYRCGLDWADANGKCGQSCVTDGECENNEKCFNGVNQTMCF